MNEGMTTPTLDAALAVYSLTRDDLPGIAEAWEERFVALSQPLPETEEEVLTRLRPNLSGWIGLSVDDVIPRSDGTLEVDVEGEVEEGDRQMYTCDRLALTASESVKFLRAREDAATRRQLNALRSDAEHTAAGAHPIWWLLADEPRISSRHSAAARALANARGRVEHLQSHLGHIEQMQTALDTHTPIPEAEQKAYPTVDGFSRGVKSFSAAGKQAIIIRVDILSRNASDLGRHVPELARMQEAIDAAHALPAGALRDYLVGEREAQTYLSVEGTGRKKKSVKRTYTPTSDLVKDHRRAVDLHARAATERDKSVKLLAELRAESTPLLQAAQERLAQAEANVAAVWAEGWPGGDTPEPRQSAGEDFWD